ncbi:MAG: tyrosine-type recombinase/integrase [Rhodospirillales bacterium]|nr:tyrosine-type recombinase/integrase [Rhodospirillales bacterium]
METIAKHKLRPSKSFTEQHPILGGDAIIYRTKQNGDVFQFRTWIPGEKKYYRKTLKTRDLETATERGRQLFYDIQVELRTGKKLFGLTMLELVDGFLSYQDERVATGKITRGRHSTIKTQLNKHLFGFLSDGKPRVGQNLKVNEIDKARFYDFAQYRRITSKGVKEVTIRNEQTTLNALFRWGFRNGYVHFEKVDFEEIKIRSLERRDTFTLDEWKQIYLFMRNKWIREVCPDKELERRKVIREFILIKANTFMRFGELRQLKWGDVRTFQQANRREDFFVEVNVRAETAKNRKARKVLARGGDYFERLKRFSKHTKNDDLVFVDNDTGKAIPKKVYYELWKDLIGKVGISTENRTLTYYSLRHFGITARRYAGVSFEDLSLLAGTSFSFIENHYSHVDTGRLMREAVKDFSVDENGFIVRTSGREE